MEQSVLGLNQAFQNIFRGWTNAQGATVPVGTPVCADVTQTTVAHRGCNFKEPVTANLAAFLGITLANIGNGYQGDICHEGFCQALVPNGTAVLDSLTITNAEDALVVDNSVANPCAIAMEANASGSEALKLVYVLKRPGKDAPASSFGTSSAPVSSATADKKFVSRYTQSTDATGADSRGMYLRHYLAGAGASGETLRSYTTVTAAGAVAAHGTHSSLSFSGSGTLTGLGCATRSTLHVPNSTLGGTSTAVQAELYADGASSDASKASFLRAAVDGNATGVAALEDSAAFIDFDGFTVGAGNMLAAKSSAAVSHTLRCRINGTNYWIMLSNAQ